MEEIVEGYDKEKSGHECLYKWVSLVTSGIAKREGIVQILLAFPKLFDWSSLTNIDIFHSNNSPDIIPIRLS